MIVIGGRHLKAPLGCSPDAVVSPPDTSFGLLPQPTLFSPYQVPLQAALVPEMAQGFYPTTADNRRVNTEKNK